MRAAVGKPPLRLLRLRGGVDHRVGVVLPALAALLFFLAPTMPVRERPGADERLVGGFREGMAVEYNSFSRGGW